MNQLGINLLQSGKQFFLHGTHSFSLGKILDSNTLIHYKNIPNDISIYVFLIYVGPEWEQEVK
ncbi:hypothetical protein J31TS6_08390 [Brevibacillus reuszeri]|nr:hypothetical protein J31TS6_08390 [Brevibacillus reuszeri]